MVKKTVISVIYRHPAPQYNSFTKELENILHNLNDNKVTYHICGDFNLYFLQHESSQQVKNSTNLMLAYNCTQLITRPTRVTDPSATLLDHVYSNNIKMPVHPGIILSDLCDHLPTFVMIKFTCLKQKHLSMTLRNNYKNLDRSTVLQEINDALDTLPVNNGNPCQVVDNIHSTFHDTMQKHTPLQPLSRNRRKLLNKPWITQALYKSIKEKNKIYRSLVKNGFEIKSNLYITKDTKTN